MFPIMKLPYGCRRRLSTLTTPVEKYKFQIAGGNVEICPPTFQKCKKSSFNLRGEEDGLVLTGDKNAEPAPIVFAETDLILSNEVVINLTEVILEDLSSDVFNHFLIQVYKLHLMGCDTSKPFLEALSKLCFKRIRKIEFNFWEEEDFAIQNVFQAFPHIEELKLHDVELPDHWLNDIMKVWQTKLDFVYIKTDYKKVGKFGADELFSFLQAQGDLFTLTLHMEDLHETDPYAKALKKVLRKHLVLSPDPKQWRPVKQIRIVFEAWIWSYYVPNKRNPRQKVSSYKNPRSLSPVSTVSSSSSKRQKKK